MPFLIPVGVIQRNVGETPLNYDYNVYLFIPARLGLHYILLNKVETLRNYQDIETFLVNKSEGNKTIWDLYTDYLSNKLI
jgi:hypothetical protein